jgi:hypothetical protein
LTLRENTPYSTLQSYLLAYLASTYLQLHVRVLVKSKLQVPYMDFSLLWSCTYASSVPLLHTHAENKCTDHTVFPRYIGSRGFLDQKKKPMRVLEVSTNHQHERLLSI